MNSRTAWHTSACVSGGLLPRVSSSGGGVSVINGLTRSGSSLATRNRGGDHTLPRVLGRPPHVDSDVLVLPHQPKGDKNNGIIAKSLQSYHAWMYANGIFYAGEDLRLHSDSLPPLFSRGAKGDEAEGLGHGPFQEPVGLPLSWNRRKDSSNVASRPRKRLEDDRADSP